MALEPPKPAPVVRWDGRDLVDAKGTAIKDAVSHKARELASRGLVKLARSIDTGTVMVYEYDVHPLPGVKVVNHVRVRTGVHPETWESWETLACECQGFHVNGICSHVLAVHIVRRKA